VCCVLIALVVVLRRYGIEGHSSPTRRVSRRNSPLA
jgi:hypothetical protein